MEKQATVRSIRAAFKIEHAENGWTLTTNDGNVFVFSNPKEMATWFCMIVGVPLESKQNRARNSEASQVLRIIGKLLAKV